MQPTEIKKRHSFSMSNAVRFKEAFDKALDNLYNDNVRDKDILIPYEELPNLMPSTLKQRVSEALGWLKQYADELPDVLRGKYTQVDYAALRGCVKLSIRADGLLIRFTVLSIKPVQAKNMEGIDARSWKAKLEDFINGDDSIFNLRVNLSDDEVEWVKNYLSPLGVEYKVDNSTITVAK